LAIPFFVAYPPSKAFFARQSKRVFFVFGTQAFQIILSNGVENETKELHLISGGRGVLPIVREFPNDVVIHLILKCTFRSLNHSSTN
jgi:hypothetical protein